MKKVCFYCRFYTLERNPDNTGNAYCRHFKRFFPNQDQKPAAFRTCEHWEHIIGKMVRKTDEV